MALASKILQRVIVTPTATSIYGATALAGAFADTGLLLPQDLSCGDVDAADVSAGTVEATGTLSTGSLPANAMIQGVMSTALVDFLAAPALYPMTPSAFAGRYFLPALIRFVIDQINGTITTGPTINIGNNAAHNNVTGTTANFPSAVAMNAINTAGTPGMAVASSVSGQGLQLTDCVNTYSLQITVAAVANTATIAKGRMFLAGWWIVP